MVSFFFFFSALLLLPFQMLKDSSFLAAEAIDAFELQFPDLRLSDVTKAVMLAGLAAHHAGQMPAQRAPWCENSIHLL